MDEKRRSDFMLCNLKNPCMTVSCMESFLRRKVDYALAFRREIQMERTVIDAYLRNVVERGEMGGLR